MAIIHIKLTKEHIALIRAMNLQEDGDDVMYLNKNYLFGGTHIMEDLTDILGFHDKYIKGTEEDPNGKAFPDDIEKHCLEVYNYIKDNFSFIESLVLKGHLHTSASGLIPIFRKSLTLFCVGLVFSSFEPYINGINVQ